MLWDIIVSLHTKWFICARHLDTSFLAHLYKSTGSCFCYIDVRLGVGVGVGVTLQVLRQSFYVMGKADELSYTGTGLVKLLWILQNWKHLRKIMPINHLIQSCVDLFF